MPGEAIDSLFVRLGLETDQQQFEQAESQFSSLQSTVLQFGALIGGGIGLQDLTFGFSESVDEMNRFAEVMEGLGVTPQFVNQMQGAFALIRGEAEEAIPFMQNLAGLIEDTDWGQINDSALARGLDLSGLQEAETIQEAMAALNEQMREIEDPERARRLGDALGFSEDQIRLLRDNDIGQVRQEAERLNPLSGEMTGAAREFSQGWNELSLAMTGLKNEISESFVGDLGQSMQDMADAIAENREEIAEFWGEAKPILKGIAGGIATMVAINAARAGIGALRNIPGATLLAAAIGGAITSGGLTTRDRGETPEEQVRRQISRRELMQGMPEELSVQEQRRWMQGGARDRREIMQENNITIQGAQDPEATARAVRRELESAADNTREDVASEAQ